MDQLLINISLIGLCLLSMTSFSDTSPDTGLPCTLQNGSDAADDVTSGDLIMSSSRQQVTSPQEGLLPRSALPLTPFLTRSTRRYIPQDELVHEPREDMFPGAQSRRQLAMPWSCEGAAFWRDLGRDHHPRYVREVSCEQKFCWFGHYKCQPRRFVVKVLHRISSPPPGCPADLDGKWRLKDVSLALYCECGH